MLCPKSQCVPWYDLYMVFHPFRNKPRFIHVMAGAYQDCKVINPKVILVLNHSEPEKIGIKIRLSWRHLRLYRCRKNSSQGFSYLTNSRKFWEMTMAINSLFGVISTPRRQARTKSTENALWRSCIVLKMATHICVDWYYHKLSCLPFY